MDSKKYPEERLESTVEVGNHGNGWRGTIWKMKWQRIQIAIYICGTAANLRITPDRDSRRNFIELHL